MGFTNVRVRRAAKPYRCDSCEGWIAKGERHSYVTGVNSDVAPGILRARECAACSARWGRPLPDEITGSVRNRNSTERRAAFLAGEGTLTFVEIDAWAQELGEPPLSLDGLDDDTPLMVSVARDVTDAELREAHERSAGLTHSESTPEAQEEREARG